LHKVTLRVRLTPQFERVTRIVTSLGIHTVCEQALCPNIHECWGSGTATFMVMGDTCTRGCRFCYVKSGKPGPLDPTEPLKVAIAAKRMGLRYVTITSVDRDDLPDGGAGHIARVVREVKRLNPGILVEALIPDFQGDERAVMKVLEAGPDVVAHNVETVRRLTPLVRDRRAGYDQSLRVLGFVKKVSPSTVTKSSILLGFGEKVDEVVETMRDLRRVGVDILVLSQYLRPSPKHLPVKKMYTVEEFRELEEIAYDLGFSYVLAHPLARTSYKAWEAFLAATRGGLGGRTA